MSDIAARVERALKAAGVPVIGVSIGRPTDKSTWTVNPTSLQSEAQPTIDAFTVLAPPTRSAVALGSYLGLLDSDPESPRDGDLWIVRSAFPTQRRIVKVRDGKDTMVLQTVVL